MGGRARTFGTALDRTAVLAVGLAAGFAVGLSFNAAGRRQALGWLTGAAPPATVGAPPAPSPPIADKERPEIAALLAPRVVARVKAAGRVTVGVFGDSYGDGIWSALYHQLPEKQRFAVLRFSKEATGFTRYKTLNLEDRARAQLAAQPIDVAVISFGANDIQPIFEGGHLRLLMSPDWQAIIGERIERFVRVARSTGAAVFWVGLPVMRDGDLDANVQAMNAFYAARMKALGVHYVETRSRSVDARGGYDPYLPDAAGAPRLMRTGDGIHMTIPGYIRLTAPLAQRLREDAAQVWRHAGMALPPVPSPVPVASPSAAPARPSPRPLSTARPAPSAAESERLKTARANRREADRTAPAASPTPEEMPKPAATPDAERGKTTRANRREEAREKKAEPAAEPSKAAEP